MSLVSGAWGRTFWSSMLTSGNDLKVQPGNIRAFCSLCEDLWPCVTKRLAVRWSYCPDGPSNHLTVVNSSLSQTGVSCCKQNSSCLGQINGFLFRLRFSTLETLKAVGHKCASMNSYNWLSKIRGGNEKYLYWCLQGAQTIIFWACRCIAQRPVVLQTQIHKASLILTADYPACSSSIDDHRASHDVSHIKTCCYIGFIQRNSRESCMDSDKISNCFFIQPPHHNMKKNMGEMKELFAPGELIQW